MTIKNLYQLFLQHPVVATDSRNCPANSLFFALKGENFDGNDYILQALESGASFAIGDRRKLPCDRRIIRVEDTLATLQQLACYHRMQLKTKVIAVTGTNGKTTTKELIAAALSCQYAILYTRGNLNNHIGVPLTLLGLKPEHDFAVIEMGANHPGEIAALCRISRPDFGIVTNIGKAHLEGFGSFEGVIKTKTELYSYIQQYGKVIFANADNSVLKQYISDFNAVTYGVNSGNFLRGDILSSAPFLSMEWQKEQSSEKFKIDTHLVGKYNFENVMAAVCIASYFNVGADSICSAISDYIPQNNRSQSMKTAYNKLIIDAYNANPTSMKAALENFITLPDSPKMLILGEMRELGNYSREEHENLINIIRQNAVDKVILCGDNFVGLNSLPSGWKVFSTTDSLLHYLRTEKISGYTILIKGSRANRLEQTVEFL
jgi:UDP-N-acetylmuramoyl-tripeptide--D-alanyl-D-alanine ligase